MATAGSVTQRQVHYMALGRVKKAYREVCHLTTLGAAGRGLPDLRRHPGAFSVRLTFRPPTKARRDMDNLMASMKAGLDGVADALGVDDSRFVLEKPELTDERMGMVVVVVTLLP